MAHYQGGSAVIKILLPPSQDDGCTWYRFRQYCASANKQELASVEYLDLKLDDRMVEEAFKACDAFVIRFYSESYANVMRTFQERYPEKLILLDTDDDMFNISPLNNSYETFGTEEVTLPDGRKLWEHGKARFDLYENRKRAIDYQYCLERADGIITTTLRLANKLREYNEAVGVIPNAINPIQVPRLELKRNPKEIRLMWAGGSSHFEDLMEIKNGLLKLMQKYPQLHFHMVGQQFGAVLKGLPEKRVHTWPWVKADGHGYRLACVGADIAIAPLRDVEFNHSKSCIKWYEYSALGVASALSAVPPYSDEAKDGLNAMLFKDDHEFVEKVSQLIDDPVKRLEIAENAYRWVMDNRHIDEVTKDWVEFITELVKTKSQLPPAKAGGL
jgi:glycosyltransferase involved in cell wall biosynthesis